MRMWGVYPGYMCRQHLLGEHVEMPMAVGAIRHDKSISGYTNGGLLDTSKIQHRHDTLVIEMQKRGYKHRSPLHYDDVLQSGSVDVVSNLSALRQRCVECNLRGQVTNHDTRTG